MSDVHLDGNRGRPVHLAEPAPSRGRVPGVLVVHGGAGCDAHVRGVGERLAAHGYVTMVPDFGAVGPHGTDRADLEHSILSTPDRRILDDLAESLAALAAHDRVRGSLGCVAFSVGARHALLAAAAGAALDAVVACWPAYTDRTGPPRAGSSRPAFTRVTDQMQHVHGPVMIACGELDTNPTPATAQALAKSVPRHGGRARVYRGAGHAFLADGRPSYRADAAAALWADLVAFLDEHLCASCGTARP